MSSSWKSGYLSPRAPSAPPPTPPTPPTSKKHILPTLGRVKLQKLTPVMINSLYAQLLKDGKVCGSGGLSANSVTKSARHPAPRS